LTNLRSTTSGHKDIGVKKSEFVAKTQFLSRCVKFPVKTVSFETHKMSYQL